MYFFSAFSLSSRYHFKEVLKRNFTRLPGGFPVCRWRDEVRHRPGVFGLTKNFVNTLKPMVFSCIVIDSLYIKTDGTTTEE